jgi:predicted hydrocarbon binding protein
VTPFDYFQLIRTGLVRSGLALMIRDTFETNRGLCELFKYKMRERARLFGLSEGLIDFESHIDVKGTYEDNLRIFYREYPQLSQDSDYLRIKSFRTSNGAALERKWRSYERSNGHGVPQLTRKQVEQPLTGAMMPELAVTYTIGGGSGTAPAEATEHEPISAESVVGKKADSAPSTHGELVRSILDRVTATAGEKATGMMLHHIGQEIGLTAFNHSRHQILPDNLREALDHALRIRGWGRVLDLGKTERGRSVTYACTISECSLCYKRLSTSPTCDVMRGIVSRWLEAFVQRKAERIEATCAESRPCVFRVTFSR